MASSTVVAGVVSELRRHPPFNELPVESLSGFASGLTVVYFAAGETVLAPNAGAPDCVYIVKSGRIVGERRGATGDAVPAMELLSGELFPIGAVLTDRPVQSTFRAATDSFCYRMPAGRFKAEVERNPLLQDFAERRLFHLLERSRTSLRAAYAAERLTEHPFAQPLSSILHRPAVSCPPEATIELALQLMHSHKVGAIVLVDAAQTAQGILTERDVIGRITLPQVSLAQPVASVASRPVVELDEGQSLSLAALTMVERNIRHIVVTRDSKVCGVISERNLFALQRQTLAGLSDALANAPDQASLARCAADIRLLSRTLVAQGVSAGLLTQFISRLNDQLTQRIIGLQSIAHGLADMAGLRWCWLAFGSEGRHEQTISTDQDNGIIFESPAPADAKPRLLAFALAVNRDLADCGFPLCKGQIMASNPELTLTVAQWHERFARWIDAGDPQSLLNASIFFDFRALTGDEGLLDALSPLVFGKARENARFRKQMAQNALTNRPLLNWMGRIDSARSGADGFIDLKRHGAMPFTDSARLLALACGVTSTRTVDRLRGAAAQLKLAEAEVQGWSESFEFVQMLRLRHQHARLNALDRGQSVDDNPNLVRLTALSELDQRILREAFRQARTLQQRIELDYGL